MTQGGPRGVTDLLVYYDWRTAFRVGDIGFASAIAVFMFVFVLSSTSSSSAWGGNGMRDLVPPRSAAAGWCWWSSLLTVVVPIVWGFSLAFRSNEEIARIGGLSLHTFVPVTPTLDNFAASSPPSASAASSA